MLMDEILESAMRKISLVLGVTCAALACLLPELILAQPGGGAVTADAARVIVKFRADSVLVTTKALAGTDRETSRAQALGERVGVAMSAGAPLSDRAQVVFAAGVSSAALAARLAAESDVEYAVPDERKRLVTAPNDPLYANGVGGNGPAVGQWYLRAPDSTVLSSINAEAAWSITTGSPSVVVADLDTGVRFEHPDLLAVAAGGNLLPGYCMISDPGTANNTTCRGPDASDPGDWVTEAELSQRHSEFYQCEPAPTDSSWHGTQTAGLIAALTNNGIGMASVGRTVELLPVRVLGKCGGFDSDIIAGMFWAAGFPVPGVPANPTPAQVINLSLGGAGACNAAYADAVNHITAARTVIVVAAGNSTGNSVGEPGNCPGVIAVGGLRHAGTKVGFSSLGPEIAISAPAGNCINIAVGSPCLYPILTTSNSGTTTPASSIYTDSYNPSLGTSFSTPLVSGTVALMFAVQPLLTPWQARVALESTARPFPTTSTDSTVTQCTAPQYDVDGNPIDQLECLCTIDTCGAGMLDAGAAVSAASAGLASGVQAEGLWWKLPAGSESGWGINFVQQGNVIFATWFTYDVTGKAWWLVMTANKTGTSPDTYTGALYATHGPAFSAVPFDPNLVTSTSVGSGTLTFPDTNRATFTYIVGFTQQTKTLTREVFGTLPKCTYSAQPDFASASNYQDLWWAAPAGSESGWGINLTHQGDTIFATWFTYDVDNSPMWLVVTATKTAPGVYTGTLYRTTGPAFNSVPFNPALVAITAVGTSTLAFANGNAATFAYSVNGVAQAKQITRELFAPPAGTLCQ
jgi:serine protease